MQPYLSFPLNNFTIMYPDQANRLGIRKHSKEVEDFFIDVVEQTIQFRLARNENRNDFLQLLMDAELTTNEIAALSFDFLSAGYSDSTSILSYCIYELSMNADIQVKARKEIESVLEKYKGELTHDAVNEMDYCKLVIKGNLLQKEKQALLLNFFFKFHLIIIKETLRKHPAAGKLMRVATKPFKVPNTNFTIPKGMLCFIPVLGFHHDPRFFPNPDPFCPERFTEGDSVAFMPFGDGT